MPEVALDIQANDFFSFHASSKQLYQVRGDNVRILGTFDGGPRRPSSLFWSAIRSGALHTPLDPAVAQAFLSALDYAPAEAPIVPHLEVFVSDLKNIVFAVPNGPKSREIRHKTGWFFVGTIPVTPPTPGP